MSIVKETAKNLVIQFRTPIQKADKYRHLLPSEETDLAKDCAIIAVNAIIEEIPAFDQGLIDFYKRVKYEIQNYGN